MSADGSPHVVVVGAGFAGLAAAKRLGEAGVRTTVIDRNNFHTFQPLLYQVATAALNPADVAYPVRGIFRRHKSVSYHQGSVIGVDWDAEGLVIVAHDEADDREAEAEPIAYDHLIVAAGAAAHFFGVSGAAEHSFPLYGLEEAVRLRNHLLRRFEAADSHPELVDEGVLTIVIVGGGPTGVEVAGATIELVHGVMAKDYPRLDVARARVVLVEGEDHLLGPFSAVSQRSALDTLRRRGVEVRLGVHVSEVEPGTVTLTDGSTIDSHTLVWAAGVQASPLAGDLEVEQGHGGRIVVGPDLEIPGHPGCFAVGDVAEITPPGAERPLPQLAQVAIQSGRHAAEQVLRREAGRPTEPFEYEDKGTMATIGRRAAVAELPWGLKLRGPLGWWAWLLLHLVMLVGFRNRISVLLNWFWNYITHDRGARLILEPKPTAPPLPPPPGDPDA